MPHVSKRKVRKLEDAGDSPSLIGWLRTEDLDSFSVSRISDALGRLGDPLAIDALLEACAHALDPERPLRALASIGDKRAVPTLSFLCDHWYEKRTERGSAGPWNIRSWMLGIETMKELAGDSDGIAECIEAVKEGLRRYHKVAWTDLNTWEKCPLCGSAWAVRVDRAAHCSRCCRYFSGDFVLPHASDGSDGKPFGTLIEAVTWTVLLVPEAWMRLNKEREADGLVTLPPSPVSILTPTVEGRVAWQFDEFTMGAALRGGPDTPPQLD